MEKTFRARFTEDGRQAFLWTGWTPAYERAVQDVAEDFTDSAGISWWLEQGRKVGLTPEDSLKLASAASDSLKRWGRLYDEPAPNPGEPAPNPPTAT